jgi:membrane-bound ClpP family serine protease
MPMLGVSLMVVGAALVVAEPHVPTHGVLGTGAATALTAGVVLGLLDAGAAGGAVVASGATVALAWLLLVKSLAARRLAIRGGPRALAGRPGTVRTVPAPLGQVQLDGAESEPMGEGTGPVSLECACGYRSCARAEL